MPQYLTAAHSVCRKNYIVDKNGVAGAEPPTGTRGGSPTLSPGKDAGRVCPKALHDAEPTKHTQPFTTGKGFGVRDREFALSYKKTDFFYKLYVPQHPTAAHFLYVFYTKKRKTLAY